MSARFLDAAASAAFAEVRHSISPPTFADYSKRARFQRCFAERADTMLRQVHPQRMARHQAVRSGVNAIIELIA